MHVRALVFHQVNAEARATGLSAVNHLFMLTVLFAVAVQICETEPLLAVPYHRWFRVADLVVGVLFCADLSFRIWAAGEVERFRGLGGRVRYLFQPRVIIDGLAVLPFVVSTWIGFLDANDLAFLRLVTAVEILLNSRLGRLSAALGAMRYAVMSRREELLIGLVLAFAVMVAAAVGLYLVEGSVQPNAFGSIPRALWWSLETLTTVGYGDVFPHTVLGKLLAGLFALAGIGIVAIPTGILAAAFGDAFRAEKSARPSVSMKPGMRTRVVGSVPANKENL
ncbi:MAG: ion transporter [Chromatiaceae bacterium]|nr:ion transporter [Chromatiaceae bacterium]